ncbi:hypothetical protein BH10PAT3_BH10PAT3_5500 [soil metagenome]
MIVPRVIMQIAQLSQSDVNIPTTSAGSDTVNHALQIFFAIAGAVAMLIIAIGAFKYVLSRGDANSIKNSKDTILYAVIGLIVTITAYGIVTFVVTKL